MSKRLQTQEKWIKLIEQFNASNQNAKDCCQKNNISYQSFIQWKNKLKSKNNFIELHPQEPFELSYLGIKISFTNFEQLKKLKSLLESLC